MKSYPIINSIAWDLLLQRFSNVIVSLCYSGLPDQTTVRISSCFSLSGEILTSDQMRTMVEEISVDIFKLENVFYADSGDEVFVIAALDVPSSSLRFEM
ncbi:unnamed protein product [Caenorhabditis brenneri]